MTDVMTLETAQAQLTAWINASTAAASGQSYSIGNRSLSRADASEIREMIKFWQGIVNDLSPRTKRRTRYGVPQ